MNSIATITLLVPSYQAGIDFFVTTLGFELLENTALAPGKRWVLVSSGPQGCNLLLAEATTPAQQAAIGQQAGDRVFGFISTDDFERDYRAYSAAGVVFNEQPRHESYGTVAVFTDPFGNKWDLIQYS